MSRRATILTGIAFGLVVATVALAPFPLMLVSNPVPVAVVDVTRQLPGNFISTGGRTFRVFPRAEKQLSFPGDSLQAGSDAQVLVKYRQLSSLNTYVVRDFRTGEAVSLARETSSPHLLVLRPVEPLSAGRYYAVIARESLYGGSDYVYFSVRR